MPPTKQTPKAEEPDPGFPIYDLPILMIQDTLNKLTPLDIIKYTTCSEKCQDNVKKIFYRTPVELDIKLEKYPSVTFEWCTGGNEDEEKIKISHRDKDWQSDNATYSNICGQIIAVEEESKRREWPVSLRHTSKMVTFWKDPREGFFTMGNLITDAFNNLTIGHISFCDKWHKELVRVVEWLKSKKLTTVISCAIQFKMSPSDNVIKYIFENIQINNDLFIDVTKASRNANLNIPDHLKSLRIFANNTKYPSLHELEKMTSFNYEKLEFAFSLSRDDIVQFVKKCLDLEYPKLAKFEVYGKRDFSLNTIAKQIERPKTGNKILGFRFERSDGKSVTIREDNLHGSKIFKLRVHDTHDN